MFYEFIIDPVAKPRMTRRDKYNPGQAAIKYFSFRTALRLMANLKGLKELSGIVWIKFFIQYPESWSDAKKKRAYYTPHCQRPDLDNLIKGILDTLTIKEDSHIHTIKAQKLWFDTGKIQIKI